MVHLEGGILAEDRHGNSTVQQQTFDEHPVDDRQRGVELHREDCLAEVVLT